MGWEERSACLALVRRLVADGVPRGEAQQQVTTMFYPDIPKGMSRRYALRFYVPARQVCASCPVRAECLADAVATEDFRGVRAGLDPLELLRLTDPHAQRIPA